MTYRLLVIRDGRSRAADLKGWPRLYQALSVDRRGGAQDNASSSFDGEALLLAFHGISDFDILALDGDDLRKLPLSLRKQKLQGRKGRHRIHARWRYWREQH